MEVALRQSVLSSSTRLAFIQSSTSTSVGGATHSLTTTLTLHVLGFKNWSTTRSSPHHLHCLHIQQQHNNNNNDKRRRRRNSTTLGPRAQTTSTSGGGGQTWLLQPVGDGDSRHIGFKVPLPDAYEITSSEVTVGRVPDRADLVIPIATVSGLHARLEMKDGNLVVTDLNSTNGTFIDDKRLTPGVPAIISPGRLLTFGDTNLAIFRVSRLQNSQVPEKDDAASETEAQAGDATNKSESTT